jgi:hypothetical protein
MTLLSASGALCRHVWHFPDEDGTLRSDRNDILLVRTQLHALDGAAVAKTVKVAMTLLVVPNLEIINCIDKDKPIKYT